MTPVTLSGVRDGVTLRIEMDVSRAYPGKPLDPSADDIHRSGTLVVAQAKGEDVLVCRRALSDQIVGPVPAVPRRRTGDAVFDDAFDVFSTDAEFDATSFPPAHARAALLQLGLKWLRRKDGRLEMFLEKISPNQAECVVSLTVALADTQHSVRISAITVPQSDGDRFDPAHISWPLSIASCVALLFGLLGGLLLPLVPAVHTALADIACDDPRAKVVATTSQFFADTYHGVICMREGMPPVPTSDALNYACAGIAACLPLAIGLFFTLVAVVRLWRQPVSKA